MKPCAWPQELINWFNIYHTLKVVKMSQLLSTCAHSAVNIWTQLPSTVKCRVKGDAGNCGRSWTIVLVSALHLPPYLYLPKKYKHLSSTKCSCGITKISAGHMTDTTTNHLSMLNWHFWPLKQNILQCWNFLAVDPSLWTLTCLQLCNLRHSKLRCTVGSHTCQSWHSNKCFRL